MFNFIHLQPQGIKGNVLSFGGINIITIGDLYQLKLVKDGYIFENLRVGYLLLTSSLWCNHFKIFELTEIMRQ